MFFSLFFISPFLLIMAEKKLKHMMFPKHVLWTEQKFKCILQNDKIIGSFSGIML